MADTSSHTPLIERLDQGVPVLVARDQLQPTEGGVGVFPQTNGVSDVVRTTRYDASNVASRDVVLLDHVPRAVRADLTGNITRRDRNVVAESVGNEDPAA